MSTRAILIVVVAIVAYLLVRTPQKDILLIAEEHFKDVEMVTAYEEEAMRGKICLAEERGVKSYGAERPLDGMPNVYGLEEQNVYSLTTSALEHMNAIRQKGQFDISDWAYGIKTNPLRREAWKLMKRPFPDRRDEQLASTIEKWDLPEDVNTYHYQSAVRVNQRLSLTLLEMLEQKNQLSNFKPEHQTLFKDALLSLEIGAVHKRFRLEVATDLRNRLFADVIIQLYQRCSTPIKVIVGYHHVIGLKDILVQRLPEVKISEECLPNATLIVCRNNYPLCERCKLGIKDTFLSWIYTVWKVFV